MTDENTALETADTTGDRRRKLAILKFTGFDRVPAEQRELAVTMANRYDLKLDLRHLIPIDGKPYITRDGLLWIAHRSGVFDGMAVSRPVLEDDFWHADATVWRKDMSHPFTFHGRYPAKGRNVNVAYAPEMATKVAESMALRRAFNVSAPSQDERWADLPDLEPAAPRPSVAELAAQRASGLVAEPTGEDGATEALPENPDAAEGAP